MSDDRLEKALEAMKNEDASPGQIEEARANVWQRLESHGLEACAEFQPAFQDYLDGNLADNRRVLMEDHLSRCTRCRTQLAGLKGEHVVVAMPQRPTAWLPQWGKWALAAGLVLMAIYLGRGRIDQWFAPGGPRATLASLDGGLYRVPQGVLLPGAGVGEGEVVRTGPGARAMLRLDDGSMIDMNERTELFLSATWSGRTIHLQRGDIVVQAAKQRRGHLRVQTRDSIASVKGTVFAVSSGLQGTLVSVVEGSVAVARAGSDEVVVSPGGQAASDPALMSSVQEAVSWSPDAQTYIALLESLAKIDRQLAELPGPALRTEPRLLKCLTPNAVVYGAIPNLGGTISQTMALVEQQAAESSVFRAWWNSTTAQELKLIVDRIQKVTPLLGDEVVFVFAQSAPDASKPIPILLAEVQPGKRAELASALDALRGQTAEIPLPYSLNDMFLVISDSQADLQWAVSHLGQGAATSFAEAIAARYQRGAGWLIGMDLTIISALASDVPKELSGSGQLKHVFFEQRTVRGVEQNEVTLTFRGSRMGMASWLASGGSGGAAEYLSADASFAAYVSTREPGQLFDELMGLANMQSSGTAGLSQAESKLGANFARDLAAAFGTESALGFEGLSTSGPVWMLAVLVNDPATIDASVRKLVELYNAEVAAADESKRITVEQETVDGRLWTTLKPGILPVTVTWTYDRGYLVAGSDRGVAGRAIATRNGGSPLVWSPTFQQQLPSSTGLHPSGFVWLNTKGAFQSLASLLQNQAAQKLFAERDPILTVFNGTADQIHSASRIRLSGLIIDLMRLGSLGGARSGFFQ